MSEPKTKPTDASVEDFLATVEPARRREEGRTLCALMQAASGEAPVMWGPSIVGFGRYANVTANGKSAHWPRMGFFAAQGGADLLSRLDPADGGHAGAAGAAYDQHSLPLHQAAGSGGHGRAARPLRRQLGRDETPLSVIGLPTAANGL
ncbi:hypothetical protein [Brevundimonas vancanneytii]|uniref:DUF1801 domain-containing protein n=1 Tax=Brevundimonas vancanneytii TaxID=1325724 RepID=A0A4P1JWU2_9CAUL|nr:hypothetical protein [Brevundimonas vancanneytii]VTO12788.1 Uncharacterised protein [Brevundimonas vancanneytii]